MNRCTNTLLSLGDMRILLSTKKRATRQTREALSSDYALQRFKLHDLGGAALELLIVLAPVSAEPRERCHGRCHGSLKEYWGTRQRHNVRELMHEGHGLEKWQVVSAGPKLPILRQPHKLTPHLLESRSRADLSTDAHVLSKRPPAVRCAWWYICTATWGPRPVKWCKKHDRVIQQHQPAAASSGITSFSMTVACAAANDSALK